MSSKINLMTKIVLVLTVCVPIMIIGINRFPEWFSLYHSWFTKIIGFVCLSCIILCVSGILSKKANNGNRLSCIVCALLCLALFIFPDLSCPLTKSSIESHRRISCASNMKCFMLAFRQYAIDFAGNYPSPGGAAGFELLRKNDYLTDYAVYTCPSTQTVRGSGDQPLTENLVDYVYIGGLNQKSSPRQPLMYDKPNNHGNYYGNVLFTDGTVERIEGNPWTANIKK